VRSEEVSFYSGGCTIAGTFTEAADPVAAALLIAGSGRSDRNSDARLPGGRTLRIGVNKAVAGALAGARVSALRYDKRGIGDLSHLFRPDPASAGPRAYRDSVRQPVDAEILGLIASWITRHWTGSPGPAAQSRQPPDRAGHR
jgi:hypothetical protein